MSWGPPELASKCASFNLNKLPGTWIRGIPYHMMGQEFNNKFSLGIAEYRLLSGLEHSSSRRRMLIKPKHWIDLHSSHGAVQLEVTPNNSACCASKIGSPQCIPSMNPSCWKYTERKRFKR